MGKIKTAAFETSVSEIWQSAESDFKHPLLRKVKFTLTDNKPNANNQGIESEDFDLLKQSAIDMPIKMRFLGDGVAGHKGAITIGHIRAVEDLENENGKQLIAEGVLYADEFPTEVDYLEKAFASGEAPGISWEVDYEDEKKDGIVSWLKGAIMRAATFVRNPAYGKRTAILALASDSSISDEDLAEGVKEIMAVKNDSPKNEEKGGNNKVEEELIKLREEVARLTKALAESTEAAEKANTAMAELQDKLTSQQDKIAEYEKATLINVRTQAAAEAGLKLEGEKLVAKQEFWASLSEDAFKEYLADIADMSKAAAAPKKSEAGVFAGLPKVVPSSDDNPTSINELKVKMRELSRS